MPYNNKSDVNEKNKNKKDIMEKGINKKDTDGKDLYERLSEYSTSGIYPMHMPGHKRNAEIFKLYKDLLNTNQVNTDQVNANLINTDPINTDPICMDITEIDGFDNLHAPEGILKEAQERAARYFGAKESLYLVNGSTSGLLIAISASVRKGDEIIVARNCHRAVYNAIEQMELDAVYIMPEKERKLGYALDIKPSQVEKAVREHPKAKVVIITSPTYEGIVSDIKKIAEAVHNAGMTLIVDEAHGAHFGKSKIFPESSIKCGADIIVQSVHKTLPALTQTALLHVNNGEMDRIRYFYDIYQTSSPSYILMAGTDRCVRLLENCGEELFRKYEERLANLYRFAAELKNIHIKSDYKDENIFGADPSKIIVYADNPKMTGHELYDILLHRFKIQPEMEAGRYCLLMTTVGDTEEGFERLKHALKDIDDIVDDGYTGKDEECDNTSCDTGYPERKYFPWKTIDMEKKEVLLENAGGMVSAVYVNLYPPGIPILVPGEVITDDCIRVIHDYLDSGLKVQGIKEKRIRVIKE